MLEQNMLMKMISPSFRAITVLPALIVVLDDNQMCIRDRTGVNWHWNVQFATRERTRFQPCTQLAKFLTLTARTGTFIQAQCAENKGSRQITSEGSGREQWCASPAG